MDVFERFNSKFGKWYEGLFGGENSELRPRDVLRKITAAMEDHRKEGLDGKIYVPNKYVLELAMDDAEERDYLLSFLDEEELTVVLKKFMAQNQYHTRGPLDFTIAEAPEIERDDRREKLRVKVRFEKGAPAPPRAGAGVMAEVSDDLPTVAGIGDDDEPGTVPAIAWAALAITAPDGRKQHFSLTRPSVTIGRSRNAGNDLVLNNDGMVSKAHARIERERDGQFTLFDLGSTNGVQVNGGRISGNRVLHDGDQILIGATEMTFQHAGQEDPPAAALHGSVVCADGPRRARLRDAAGNDTVLASETLIGRAVTSDIILDYPSVATRHARIVAPDAATYYLEDLGSELGTQLNGRPVSPSQRVLLAGGDVLTLGTVEMRFEAGA